MKNGRIAAPLYVLFAAVAFATSGPLARLTTGLAPVAVACFRTALAGALLLGFGARESISELRAASRGVRLRVLAAGVVLGGAHAEDGVALAHVRPGEHRPHPAAPQLGFIERPGEGAAAVGRSVDPDDDVRAHGVLRWGGGPHHGRVRTG